MLKKYGSVEMVMTLRKEINQQDATNMKFISVVYFNMFRVSLCPSSREQDSALLHVMFCTVTRGEEIVRCENLSFFVWSTEL